MDLKGTSVCSRDGEGVHVGAQENRRSRQLAFDDRDDTGVCHAGPHLEPERPQVFGHLCSGADLAVGQFGMTVEVPAPFDDPRLEGGRGRIEFGAGNLRDGSRRTERANECQAPG